MVTADHLLTVVDSYRKARGISDARVSTILFNDGKRIGLIRKGGDIGSRFLATAFHWLSDHWPPNAVWPADVPRPSHEGDAGAAADLPRNPSLPPSGAAERVLDGAPA